MVTHKIYIFFHIKWSKIFINKRFWLKYICFFENIQNCFMSKSNISPNWSGMNNHFSASFLNIINLNITRIEFLISREETIIIGYIIISRNKSIKRLTKRIPISIFNHSRNIPSNIYIIQQRTQNISYINNNWFVIIFHSS